MRALGSSLRLAGREAGLVSAGAAALALGGGAVAATSSGGTVLVATAGISIVATLVYRWGVGVAIGLFLLAGVDALPGPNLETAHVALTITGQDVAVALLVTTLIVENARYGWSTLIRGGWSRFLAGWAVGFLLLWLATAVRTALSSPVPLLHAMFTGRDFAYFAVLAVLLVGPLRHSRVRRAVLGTCALGGVLTSAVLIVATLHGSAPAFLVHTTQTHLVNGLTRLYTGSMAVAIAGFPISIGYLLLGRDPRARWLSAVLAATSGLALVLSLTRALYIGEVGGTAAAVLVWLAMSNVTGRTGRRRLVRVMALVLLSTLAIALYSPPSTVNNAVGGISQRVSSIFTDLSGSSGSTSTLAVRADETNALEYRLGGGWLSGLGFLDPTYDYIPGLPSGSIRNPDTGYLNIVMTMGVIGALIYYLPLAVMCSGLVLRRRNYVGLDENAALGFGLFAWLVGALLSSITLVILFSPTGVVSAAAVVALAVSVIEKPGGRSEGDAGSVRLNLGPGPARLWHARKSSPFRVSCE